MATRIFIERIGANIRDALVTHYKFEKQAASSYGGIFENTKKEAEEESKRAEENESQALALLTESMSDPVEVGYGDVFNTLEREIHWDVYRYRNCDFFLFRDCLYAAKGPYTLREFKLAICEHADRERKHFERLSSRHNGSDSKEIRTSRDRIPENVRRAVWRRDQGKCARCGSRELIEYDHIIPVSEGGGNTARNIELLCQRCNRSKGANIG